MTESQSNWGRWGADDERGALNLLTPEVVRHAASLVTQGTVYPLSIEITSKGVPNYDHRSGPMRLTLNGFADERLKEAYGAPGVGANEDILIMPAHSGTHLDALSHVFSDDRYYNGFPANETQPFDGAARCGVDKIGAIAGRGVLLDVAAVKGVASLEDGYIITAEDLREAIAASGITLHSGDLVFIRTGWLNRFLTEGATPTVVPGIGLAAADVLIEADVALVGADNPGVEAIPFDEGRFLSVHTKMLVDQGIHFLENVHLEDLARDGVREFLFTVSPMRIRGATGSPVAPIAIA